MEDGAGLANFTGHRPMRDTTVAFAVALKCGGSSNLRRRLCPVHSHETFGERTVRKFSRISCYPRGVRSRRTMPRFLASYWDPGARLMLEPSNDDERKCAQWSGGDRFSLSAPIIRVALAELSDSVRLSSLRKTFQYWVRLENYNCDLRRVGVLRFRMPDKYRVNDIPTNSGLVEQGRWRVTPQQLGTSSADPCGSSRLRWAPTVWRWGSREHSVRCIAAAASLRGPATRSRQRPSLVAKRLAERCVRSCAGTQRGPECGWSHKL